MKYNRLLSISISSGILLSLWAIGEKSITIGKAGNPPAPAPSASATPLEGPVLDVPITGFVKHNPDAMNQSSLTASLSTSRSKAAAKNHPKVTAWFYAQLVSEDGGNTGYIRYSITDTEGIPSTWHSKYSRDNESPNSTLFTTLCDFHSGIHVAAREDGEVLITGTVQGKAVLWTSNSDIVKDDDGDVTWTP
ncbi:MAG: hypothetical protein JOZ31_06725 [Verrucomicrobia bacterium]|nr:hypothetical protein [Verrucomicrobiota bacterium]MBV8484148.1 hypothetical protein [Verrucomicrobiota bacterium]